MTEGPPYRQNVGRWERDHPGWKLSAGVECVGWLARRRLQGGQVPVSALTLDELAVKVKEADGG